MRGGDGVRRLQPQPRSVGWHAGTVRRSPTAAFWPLYEALCELDVPAMIHVSATCNPHFHSTGSHYLGLGHDSVHAGDDVRSVPRLPGDAVGDPARRRRGAVPLGSLQGDGRGERGAGWHTLDEMMANVWFDTCVYHQPGIDLLLEVVPIENVLFASEMVGAVKGVNPDTGRVLRRHAQVRRSRRRSATSSGARSSSSTCSACTRD